MVVQVKSLRKYMDKEARRALYDSTPHEPYTRELTDKQAGFVRDYIATGGNVKEAVMRNYDAKNPLDRGYKLMNNKLVTNEIEKRLGDYFPDEMLAERHKMLLDKDDNEGKPDTMAVSKALDMAYKLKGSYAAEKHVVATINASQPSSNEAFEKIRQEFESKIKEQILFTPNRNDA
jgi:Terminase small subunit